MRTALVSLDPVWEDKQANLERARTAALQAAADGAGLIVFPEMTLTGFTMNAAAVAEPGDGSPTIAAFAALARDVGAAIAFGVVLEGEARPRNCLVVVDAEGAEAACYAKLHPFTFAGEHERYEGGDALEVVAIDGVRLGLTVCYDLRFPELYTALAPRCDAILVIANWPAARIDHWHTLLRARAIDSQCYVLGVNRTGTDAQGNEYPFSSAAVNPRGHVLAPAAPREVGAAEWGRSDLCDIDPALVTRCRSAFPTLRDRRGDLYRSFG